MAAASPSGSATTHAQNVTENVPTRSGCTPNEEGVKSGAHRSPERKSAMETSRKNSIDGSRSAAMIPTVVATETRAQRARTPLTTSSLYRRRSARSRTGPSCAPAVVPCVANAALRRLESGQVLLHDVVRYRDEERILGQLDRVRQEELDEAPHLRLLERVVLHVDEERPRERRVRPVAGRVDAGGNAAVAVVVLACVVVGAARSFLADDHVGEVVERAGISPGAGKPKLLVREARIDLVPVVDLAFRLRLPHRLQLVDGEAVDPVVRRVDD